MVKRYKFATIPEEHSKAIYGYLDKAGNYVDYADYLKIEELLQRMYESASNHYGDEDSIFEEYAKLIGDQSPMDKLHASIMEPVLERCKKALEASDG